MRLSSWIMLTAAGLAVAAPISPYSADDMSLTVEPAEVVKRENNLEPLGALTSATKTLPVPLGKRELLTINNGVLPKRGTTDNLPVVGSLLKGGLPVAKRQIPGLGSLLPGSDKAEGKEVEPKMPKSPKEPSSVADDTETEVADDSDVTGLLRRQVEQVTKLLGGATGSTAKRQVEQLTGVVGDLTGSGSALKRQVEQVTKLVSGVTGSAAKRQVEQLTGVVGDLTGSGSVVKRQDLTDLNALLAQAGGATADADAKDTAAADDEEEDDEDDEEEEEEDDDEEDEEEEVEDEDDEDDEDGEEDEEEEKEKKEKAAKKKADKKKADKKAAEEKEAEEKAAEEKAAEEKAAEEAAEEKAAEEAEEKAAEEKKEKADKKKADEKKKKEEEEEEEDDDEEDEDVDEEDEDADAEDEEEEPVAETTKGGLMGTGILARQTSSSKTVDTSSTDDTTDAATSSIDSLTGGSLVPGILRRQPVADDLLDGLPVVGGADKLLRRQLDGLLGDKKATPDNDGDDNTQTLSADDGTNGENSFDAQEEAAAEAADEKDADAEEPKKKESAGVLGGLGL